MRTLITSALLLAIGSCRAPGDTEPAEAAPHEAFVPSSPIAALDVEHYALRVTLFPEGRELEGHCTLRLYTDQAGPQTLILDLAGLQVSGVVDAAGNELEFAHEEERLYVSWTEDTRVDEAISLTVRYGGQPAQGLWWVSDRSGEPMVFTHGQCDESRWWFPCHDTPADRATSELRVTMPAAWTSLAAGERIRSEVGGALRSEEWRMSFPHPVYLTTLVAGPLESVESEWNGLPLSYLAPREWAEHLDASLAATGPALEYFSELLGMRYPYVKYAQACLPGFPFGGMENITATTLTVDALSDSAGLLDHSPDVLVAHEVAHQWIGNLVTIEDWSDIWIHEGLATYLSLMFLEETQGTDVFRAAMREKQDEYRVADGGRGRRPIVYDVYRSPSDLFSGGHAYQGGATRFHLLRQVVGDADFRSALRRLVGQHAGRSIATDDVRVAFEEASGKDLSTFFEQWLYSPGYPEVETRWRYDAARQRVILSINQVQSIEDGTPSAFQAPVFVQVASASGSKTVRIEMEKRRANVEFPCDGEPRWVRFDPNRALPAEVRAEKRSEEWLAILAADENLNGRLDALAALTQRRAQVTEEERGPLDAGGRACLASDEAAVVRSAAAAFVALEGGAEARTALEQRVLEDEALSVRRSALGALADWCPDPELAELAQRVYDDRDSWATMGAAARLRVVAQPDSGLDWVRARLVESSPNEILRRHLLSSLGGLPGDEVTSELLRWLNDETAFEEVRAEAGRQLAQRAVGPGPTAAAVRAAMVATLETPDGRLRRSIIESLTRVDDSDVRSALMMYHGRTVHDRERRAIEAALSAQ